MLGLTTAKEAIPSPRLFSPSGMAGKIKGTSLARAPQLHKQLVRGWGAVSLGSALPWCDVITVDHIQYFLSPLLVLSSKAKLISQVTEQPQAGVGPGRARRG